MNGRGPRRRTTQARMLWLGLAAGAPALLVAEYFVWLRSGWSGETQWTVSLLLWGCWWGFAAAARARALFTMGTYANLLAALREGDYSVRARGAREAGAFGELATEINLLSESMRHNRVGGLEASALLFKVIEAIDTAVFAFDDGGRLRLVNVAGARLLAAGSAELLGKTPAQLGLEGVLNGPAGLVEASFPGGPGRWDVRHAAFRQEGRLHRLLLVSDLSLPLRQEERQAWLRLIRVLGHEINNSLAPVMSLAESLAGLLEQPPEWREDMRRGLEVIGSRAAGLNRFMAGYTRMARLPPPERQPMSVRAWVEATVRLEATLHADADQLQQALINVLRNAVDAALETGGAVEAGWSVQTGWVEVWIADEGPGLAPTTNLFVPFFTTKPGGSGIGLVLSRQIVEAHGGRLALANRNGWRGCVATLFLPLAE